MPHRSCVRMTGPLALYQDDIWTELLACGYTRLSAQNVLRLASHLSRWLEANSLSPEHLTGDRIEAFLKHRRSQGYTCWLSPKGLEPILGTLRAQGVVPPAEPAAVDPSPPGQLFQAFETYLLEERGIQPITATSYVRLVRPFVDRLGLSDLSELDELSAGEISAFILWEARSSGVGYLKLKVTALRAFLRYLHVRGLCPDLSGVVPAVAERRSSGLPKAILEEEVRRIEASCDRTNATGRRDYAILLLLSRLGLRACEVAALELDDVRWAQGEIAIEGKGSEAILPLPEEVGEALVAYLKAGRPASASRRIFLWVRPPHRGMSSGAVQMVVRSASRRAGLSPVGSHQLRHSAATSMLREGVSLPDIAQALRHQSLVTTAIYAKVDFQALRPLARPWPGGVR